MIKNNSLSDRLNSYKQGADSNTSPDVISNVLTSAYVLFTTIIKVFSFGFGTKIIWNTNWKFWEVICVGLAINFILNHITSMFNKPTL